MQDFIPRRPNSNGMPRPAGQRPTPSQPRLQPVQPLQTNPAQARTPQTLRNVPPQAFAPRSNNAPRPSNLEQSAPTKFAPAKPSLQTPGRPLQPLKETSISAPTAPHVITPKPTPTTTTPAPRISKIALISLIVSVVIPPIGIILGIYVLITKSRGKNKLFGLLAVVVGVILSIVIANAIVSHVRESQLQAEQQQEQASVFEAAKQMKQEVDTYHAKTGNYPSAKQMLDQSWIKTNLSPDTQVVDLFISHPNSAYQTSPERCRNTPASKCLGYTITTSYEKKTEQLSS